ncbi:MAG: hypothetical protein JSW52_11185 [Candidatus Coatesbacteria bacterium]|nr:MAG: hypothetical protein JSW52_11185 [Candidatus Coatesbacteria bacterium]
MKKLFILALVLCVASASAITVTKVAKAPFTPPTNAYWQIIDDGGDDVLACVLEGGTTYGDGDDCRVYNTSTLDFTGVTADTFNCDFQISLVNDGPGDHCLFQMRDADDSSWTTFEDFDADTAGYEGRSYDLIGGAWGDWTVYDDVYMRFRWISDDSGTSDGVRVNDVDIYEIGNAGVDEDFDDEDLNDGVEDLDPPWWEEFYSGNGHWLVDNSLNYGYTPPGSGQFFSCDDDQYIGNNYDVAAMTPEVLDIDDTDLNIEYDYVSHGYSFSAEVWTWINGGWEDFLASYGNMSSPSHADIDLSPYLSVGDDFSIGFYYYTTPGYWDYWFCIDNVELDIPFEDTLFFDDFEGDLSLWTVVDQGSGNINIQSESLGVIKGMYR